MSRPAIAVVGAGMGGLAVAAALGRVGVEVDVYEQAPQFARIGAGIQMTPNAMAAIRGLGVDGVLRERGFEPDSHLARDGLTGELKWQRPMPESQYGAPYLCMHRAELHGALAGPTPADRIHLGKELTGVDSGADGVELSFADGSSVTADAVIGADGLRSVVRDAIVGRTTPIRNGRIAHRAVFPAELLDRDLGDGRTLWTSKARQIVIYYTTRDKSEVYFVTGLPEPEDSPTRTSWSAKGDMDELRRAFDGFHEDVRATLDACPECHVWPTLELEPLPHWSDGRIVLLGDAAHPMTPRMAQGAAMSIEDAVVLARCVQEAGDLESAFARYEAHRKARTSLVQAISSSSGGLGGGDARWLYGYDAWTADLDAEPVQPESVATAISR